MLSPGNGHGIIALGPQDSAEAPVPEILAYEQAIRPEIAQRLGPALAWSIPLWAWCSRTSPSCAPQPTFRVWHPRGPDKIEIWSWLYVDTAAPPEIKRAFRLAGLRSFSPSGTFEQDDMDNWQACTQTCRGVVSRRFPLHTQMGLGHDRFDPDLSAWASEFA